MDAAADAILAGEIVVLPTLRWYMVCCLADRVDLIERVFAAKQRPRSKSLLIVPPDVEAARRDMQFTPIAERIAAELWPGEVALRLDWAAAATDVEHLGANPLVQVGDDALAEIARRTGRTLASTSANVSGPVDSSLPGPAITVNEARVFNDSSGLAAAVLVNGGICPFADHLTIVRCPGDGSYEIERQGLVHARSVAAAACE
jgi:L-threonylcarbamoyladenylate synthase